MADASDPLPQPLPQASGLEALTFPDTVSAGGAYPQAGALATVVSHTYTFDAATNVGGAYAITITDRAGNQTLAPFQVHRDTVSPTVQLTATLATTTGTIQVSWAGSDAGAGVRSYEVWSQVDGGDWTVWYPSTTQTQALYEGDLVHTYAFRVRATDNVSNTGDWVEDLVRVPSVRKYYSVAGQRVAMRENGVL